MSGLPLTGPISQRVLGNVRDQMADLVPARKYTVEQIVANLREHEKLQGQGLTILHAWRSTNLSSFSKPLE